MKLDVADKANHWHNPSGVCKLSVFVVRYAVREWPLPRASKGVGMC